MIKLQALSIKTAALKCEAKYFLTMTTNYEQDSNLKGRREGACPLFYRWLPALGSDLKFIVGYIHNSDKTVII